MEFILQPKDRGAVCPTHFFNQSKRMFARKGLVLSQKHDRRMWDKDVTEMWVKPG